MTGDDLAALRVPQFNDAMRKLEELMTQSQRAFLIGAGCSKCAGVPLTGELTDLVVEKLADEDLPRKLLEGLIDRFKGGAPSNIEDYLSEAIDLLAVAQRRVTRGALVTDTEIGDRAYTAAELLEGIERIKHLTAEIIAGGQEIGVHSRFIKAVNTPLRPDHVPQIPAGHSDARMITLGMWRTWWKPRGCVFPGRWWTRSARGSQTIKS